MVFQISDLFQLRCQGLQVRAFQVPVRYLRSQCCIHERGRLNTEPLGHCFTWAMFKISCEWRYTRATRLRRRSLDHGSHYLMNGSEAETLKTDRGQPHFSRHHASTTCLDRHSNDLPKTWLSIGESQHVGDIVSRSSTKRAPAVAVQNQY